MAAPARGSLAHAPGGVDHRTIDIYIYIYLTSDRSQDHILTEGLAVLAPKMAAVSTGAGRAATESRHAQQAAADTKACHSIFRSCRSVFGSYSFRSSTSWFSRAVMDERNFLDPLSSAWRQITRGRESGFSLPFQRSSSRAGAVMPNLTPPPDLASPCQIRQRGLPNLASPCQIRQRGLPNLASPCQIRQTASA